MNELIEQWPALVELAYIILQLFLGGSLVHIHEYIKEKVELPPKANQALIATMSGVVALLTLVVEGGLTPESFNANNLALTFLTVLSASQFEYSRMKKSLESVSD